MRTKIAKHNRILTAQNTWPQIDTLSAEQKREIVRRLEREIRQRPITLPRKKIPKHRKPNKHAHHIATKGAGSGLSKVAAGDT